MRIQQPFHKDVVDPAASIIHANLDAKTFNCPNPIVTRKLTALIGIACVEEFA
jgi:hypothetical protein